MDISSLLLPLFLLAGAASPASRQALVCRLDALTTAERERHRSLGGALQRAIVGVSELPDGYELSVDLARLEGAGGVSRPLVQVAEWVDLESRCCPFVGFGIDLPAARGLARVRLTGGDDVKAFLKGELPLVAKGADSDARFMMRPAGPG
ncbi:MAG: hypothetical protein ABJC61_14820 [Acidobacteriota bacterium]